MNEFPFDKRQEVYVSQVESQYYDELANWFTDPVKKIYIEGKISREKAERVQSEAAARSTPAAPDPAAGDPAAGDPAAGDPAAGDPAAG